MVPSFAYSWMALISHRYFMPRLLQVANKEVGTLAQAFAMPCRQLIFPCG
jgi:hypothetical protein